MACENAAEPLQLWWQDNALYEDYTTLARGIYLGIGTPFQSFSLRPSIYDDNVIVSSITDCGSRANKTCVGYCGGVYDFSSSPTHVFDATEDVWNGTHGTDADFGDYEYFNDDISFGVNSSVAGFPIVVDQSLYGSPGVLPLGPGSTFLGAVVNSSSAPSRNWGLWTGSRSVARPVDGLLVVGGYDTARAQQDTFTNFPVVPQCTACVVITGMVYEYPGGSASLFSNSSEVLEVSLEPDLRTLDVPQYIFDNFANITQAYYNSTLELLTYPAANPPLGNLTVTLKGGYTTVIPAEELFLPPRLYNSTGDYDIINSSILIGEITNDSSVGPWYWGIPYLTMNYMTMDYDKNQFSLAHVYRGDFDNLAQPLITPLCSPTVSSNGPATATASGTSSGAPPSPGHSNHTGAIAGGVVGGVAGLVLLGALLFFILRRRRRGITRAQQPSPEQGGPPYDEKASVRLPSYTDNTKTDVQRGINELPMTPEEDQYVHRGFSPTHGLEETHMSPTITAPLEMPAHHGD